MYRNILRALGLTRAGNLAQATELLQQTLRGKKSPVRSERPPEAKAAQNTPVSTRVVLADASNEATIPNKTPAGRFLRLAYGNTFGSRSYKLYIPRDYRGRPCPLIVMLHGCTQSADDFAAGTQMNVLADEQTFFVAYPEQPASANSSKCWNWFNRRDQQRDRGEPSIIAGLTQDVTEHYAIDADRVYVAGMSAGGAAAAVLAAAYPDVYAALGVHSGLACGSADNIPSAFAAMRSGVPSGRNGGAQRNGRNSGRVIPAIIFHGDRDTTVHPRNADRFAAQLPPAAYRKTVEAGQVPAGRGFTRTTYIDAKNTGVCEQWVIHAAGHAWSGGSSAGSYTDPQGPDATREMVRFLLSHRRAQ